MLATVIINHNPFDPASRTVKTYSRARRIASLAPKTHLPFIAILNGEPVLRANNGWQRTIKDGDVLGFVVRPQGGGGGSNPLRVVLTIGLSLAAPGIGGFLASGLGITSTFGISLLSGLVSLVGGMVINALLPNSTPNQVRQQNISAASPTYSITGQGNTARLFEPIPVQYGRHLSFPDFIADPYTEYSGNEQYLYQLFCIGQGEYDIESIFIEDSPIENFPEVSTQIVTPGQRVGLFPSNVVTSGEVSGQELLNTGYVGGFVLNAPQTVCNFISYDLVFPRGLFYANDDGGLNRMSATVKFEARTIDNFGAPTGSWVVLGTVTESGATSTAQRYTYRYAVAEARYEVRATRVDAKNNNARAGHEVQWASARAYLPGEQYYGDVTLLAMRLRATNSLSAQASRRINVLATRKLPIWNGTTWSAPTVTRNPAWALADVLRAEYGAKLTNKRIDLAALLALSATYTSRGDTFDARFDSHTTIFEALTAIGEAVRTKPYQQGGVWHFWRDAPQTLPVAMFNMRNIAKGSVKTQYLSPTDDTADAIDIEYFDGVRWQWDVVSCKLPDSNATKIAKMRLFGVTSRNQAYREGMYKCAANRYRRNLVTFNTEMEGFIPTYGDLVAVQHDRPRWGQFGDVLDYDVPTRTITSSEPLDFSAGGNHYVRLKNRNGSPTVPLLVTAGANAYEIVLAAVPPFVPYTGLDEEKTSFNFGPSDQLEKLGLVRSVRPRSLEAVELSLVLEDAAVHTADTGSPQPSANWNLITRIVTPQISNLIVTLGGVASRPLVNCSWTAAAAANTYQLEYSYDNQNTWTRVTDTTATNASFIAQRGPISVRVRPVGVNAGNWVYFTGDLFALPPADVFSFLVTVQADGTRQFDASMGTSLPPDFAGYKIRFRSGTWSNWNDLNPLHDGLIRTTPYETNQIGAGNYTFAIKAVDDSGNESLNAKFIVGQLGDPRLAGVIYQSLPHTRSWNGIKTNCYVESDTGNLVANDALTWAGTTDWAAYDRWNKNPAGSITYEDTIIDLNGVVTFNPLVYVVADGTVTVTASSSVDNIIWTPFAAILGAITARYLKIRIVVTGTLPQVSSMNVLINGNSKTESINDLDTALITGFRRIGTGDIRLPMSNTYSTISQAQIALQNVGGGWSWELVDKDASLGPRIKIYNASGVLADATIDAFLRGF